MPRPSARTRVLVTGAGGPAGIAVMRSLAADPAVDVLAADMDNWAAGLYLVPPAARLLLPAGDSPGFAAAALAACTRMRADVLIPTVDAELQPLSDARGQIEAVGVRLMLAPGQALALALDKLALARACAAAVRVPRTECMAAADPASWTFPAIAKPRTGSGSRGVRRLDSVAELTAEARPGYLVQEYLPGEEYSVDVLADRRGRVVAAVPRLRARVDSGVSVAGRSLHSRQLEEFGTAAAEAIGLPFICNVQCRRDAGGEPALVEINPRPPGSLPLTIASGVDMPRLALAALYGAELPGQAFTETAMVRFLDQRFVSMADIEQVPA